MTIAKGLAVNLFASEKQFPDLVNPVQTTWDAKGRLWVAVWPTYPHWKPKEPRNDKILILEDTKGTGRADKCTVFADGLQQSDRVRVRARRRAGRTGPRSDAAQAR